MAPRKLLSLALESDNAGAVEALVRTHPELPKAAGVCWAEGFQTRKVVPEVARLLVERGAELTVHAAAGLGLVDHLAEMLAGDPRLVDAKGGDGCTPLHFARDVATAELLLRHGARVDARDEDHESTPVQWLIGDAPEVSRFLLEHGAAPDIFLAAALGDRDLAEKLVQADRSCLAHRIGRAPEFPPIGYGRGGTIYQWTLAFNSYAHQIALLKGHTELFDYLYANSDTATRLLVNCVLARRGAAETIAAQNPGLAASLPDADLELVARYCWETNTNYDAVKLMLDVGFPADHPERSHGYSPLHNAAWSGSADLVDLLIGRGHPVDIVDPTYNSTPLGFAIHDCIVEKRHPEGEFGRVCESLLNAGSPWDALEYPVGDARMDDVFRAHMHERIDGAAWMGDEAAVNRLLGPSPGSSELSLALAGAAKGGHLKVCRRLLAAGAPVNGAAGRYRATPLMYAAWSGSCETVAMLLEHGADIEIKNANGRTVLDLAVERGGDEMVRVLRKFQAER